MYRVIQQHLLHTSRPWLGWALASVGRLSIHAQAQLASAPLALSDLVGSSVIAVNLDRDVASPVEDERLGRPFCLARLQTPRSAVDGGYAGIEHLAPRATRGHVRRAYASPQTAFQVCTLNQDLASSGQSLNQPIEDYGANLSGGQRQKVALARVFAKRPKVLLLDEPSNGLDNETERLLVERFRALSGVTLIVVSHSAAMPSVTQRLVVLENGRLLADGATDQMLKS